MSSSFMIYSVHITWYSEPKTFYITLCEMKIYMNYLRTHKQGNARTIKSCKLELLSLDFTWTLYNQQLSISYFCCNVDLYFFIQNPAQSGSSLLWVHLFFLKSLPATKLQHSCNWVRLAKHLMMFRQLSSQSHNGRRYISYQSAL